MNDDISALRAQLQQLKALHAEGTLTAEAYEKAKAPLERKLLDSVLAAPAAAQRPPAKLTALLGVAVLALAGGGYLWTGSPGAPSAATPGATRSPAATADSGGAPPSESESEQQLEAAVVELAERLKSEPDNAAGWAMLGRSYLRLGRHALAVPALKQAVALRGDDATLLTEYADALAVVNGRNLDGEPSRLLAQALAIEPNNTKALLLSGMHAFQQQNYAQALQRWEKIVQLAPGGELAQQLQGVIDEARKRAGGAAPTAAASAPAATQAAKESAPGTSVSGTVTLAPALAAKARPDDTVFVFARAAEGPRMPLAILRKQVKDLPLTFTLDDSMAMSPAAKLSSTPRVVVGARVSASGNATPQAGDLQGFSAPVAPGAVGLTIQITDVVSTP